MFAGANITIALSSRNPPLRFNHNVWSRHRIAYEEGPKFLQTAFIVAGEAPGFAEKLGPLPASTSWLSGLQAKIDLQMEHPCVQKFIDRGIHGRCGSSGFQGKVRL
jgi:hypothetical protein